MLPSKSQYHFTHQLYRNPFTIPLPILDIFTSSMRKVKVTQLCPTLCDSWTIESMEFSKPEYESGQLFLSPGDLPNSGIESRSPSLQADSLPAEPPGKPKNTGVGSLSLLQGIFQLGSPALQANSLPTELSGKPNRKFLLQKSFTVVFISIFLFTVRLKIFS